MRTLLFITLFSVPSLAEDLVPFKFNSPARSAMPIQTECKFKNLVLPKELDVYVTGGGQGKRLDWQIDNSGSPAFQMDVAVNNKKRPVALLLTGSAPTIWNVGWTKDTDIVAVVVSGYQRQAVAGLPEKVPVLYTTNQGPCDLPMVSRDSMGKINATSVLLFNKEVTAAFNPENGSVLVGQDLGLHDKLVSSSWKTVDSFIDKNAPLAGEAGLRDLENKGFLRRPNERDEVNLKRFFDDLDKASAAGQTKMVGFQNSTDSYRRYMGHRSYLVIKKFTLPPALYGGNSAVFLVPENVATPDGDLGHSTMIDMGKKTCRGTSCPKGLNKIGN